MFATAVALSPGKLLTSLETHESLRPSVLLEPISLGACNTL